ncbi:MAG TPA: hypothetical protein VFT17_13230 [Propionibacteriaceae bacterium]|nr:hypothetical protein [Propionibacteriaceae bacterium]
MRSTPARAFRKMNLSVVLIIFVAASESRAVAGRRSQREGGSLAVAEEGRSLQLRSRRCRGLGCGGVERLPTLAAAGAEVGDESVTQILCREIV